MKNTIFTLFLWLAFHSGFSQTPQYDFSYGRLSNISQEKLITATFFNDVIPNYPAYYSTIIDFVSVEICVTSSGKTLKAASTSEKLTTAQKTILNAADFGTEVVIQTKFKYKDPSNDNLGSGDKIKNMNFSVMVLPEIQAEFPGGYDTMTTYLKENVIKKFSEVTKFDKDQPINMPRVNLAFTVNEDGRITDARIIKPSNDLRMDNLLLDAVNKMPNWKPAENANGTKVKQEIKLGIPYLRRGC